jgi:hypothetical protein
MTATLTAAPPTTGPARSAPGGIPAPIFQGHLPRPVRRVPLQVVPPAGPRPGVDYHRRRVVAVVVALALAVAVVLAARAGLAWLGDAATAGDTSPVPTVVVAGPGDSYWTLAGRLHAGGDVRSTVDALVAANGGRELRPGDRLVLAG